VLHLLGGGESLTAPAEVAGRAVWIGEVVADLSGLGLSSLVRPRRAGARGDRRRALAAGAAVGIHRARPGPRRLAPKPRVDGGWLAD
jgi:hypothetical protein